MKITRWAMTLGLSLTLAALAFGVMQGLPASAQEGQELGLVVFSSNRIGDNFDIFVLDPDTGLSTRLTEDPANDIQPMWSPDGELIVFASDRDGDYELYVMAADGTNVVQLTNNDADDLQPRFQPDGDFIIYVSDVNGQWDVFAITLDGMVRQLTNDLADERGPGFEAAEDEEVVVPGTPLPSPTPVQTQPDGVVNSFRLNVRANPGEGADILTAIPQATGVDIIGRHPSVSWIQIRLDNGTVGWVYQPFVTLNIDINAVPFVQAQFMPPPPTPTPIPTVEVTATPSQQQVIIEFWADRTQIASGECANLSWRVENIREVYFQGAPAVGQETRQVCPTESTTYNLRVIRQDNVEDNRYITITIQ